jgi:hypothetical protein
MNSIPAGNINPSGRNCAGGSNLAGGRLRMDFEGQARPLCRRTAGLRGSHPLGRRIDLGDELTKELTGGPSGLADGARTGRFDRCR